MQVYVYIVVEKVIISAADVVCYLQVINWLCTEGEDHLRRHVTVANNLTSIEAQLRDFTKFHSDAEVTRLFWHLSDP